LELHVCPPRFCTRVTERPQASHLTRIQARTQQWVTSLRHETVYLGDFERHILSHLDRNHDRAALVQALTGLVARGDLSIEKQGKPVREPAEIQQIIGNALGEQLNVIARNALLAN
jgi:methyltransferase-like protein